ncbi:MAG: DUF47 family protein [Candidatus Nezhaarchaeota archaeon]|nr:DUF47 family protein [Candidatus Nezhaarchaeota archaeon]MCX8142433.1 DUF47 family protein [Candidatus Nezhaarchaeota archaeon]MDW8050594.1 DUF47 family protein [Nitrososphaerota archaeon]
MAAWIWASKKVEKGFLVKCVEHSDKVLSVINGLVSVIQAVKERNIYRARSCFNDVFEAERDADKTKRNIIRDLSRATLMPIDREYIMRLILRLDDVAAYTKAAARRLVIAMNVGIELEEAYLSGLFEMTSRLHKAVELIKQAFKELGESTERALSTADKIECLEEEVDELRTSLLEFVLSKCDEKGPKWCVVAKEIVDEIEESIDRCEDVADMIRYIGVSIS